jgi:glyoxylase-like metal-dependent hydrolase (beta-lactamase superfamily II)
MAIRILDCAPMSPWFPRWHLGGTCLLVDTNQGPVLVDTGLGLHDYLSPSRKVRLFRLDFGSRQDPDTTAVRQISRLGIAPEAVKHVVMTHLHFDHAGGLPDFPHAQVHVHRREHDAMNHPSTWLELAYDKNDFSHGPSWVLYDTSDVDWLGFEAIHLPFDPEMYLVPLFGHTRGHCGVAVKDGSGWVFNCADALPTNAEFDLTPGWLNRLVIGDHVPHLKAWAASHPEVRVLAGHMWKTYFDANPRAA